MNVKELRQELNQCKADYSDCFDADAMRNRLLTTLLLQAQSEATSLPKIPRVAISLSPAWTGLVKEALCLVPAWDFERAHRMSKDDGFADSVDLTSVKTSIAEFFARDRRELLQAGEEVAAVCQDALIALCCGYDGVRLVLPVEYEDNEDQFHVPTLVYESPVPSTWRPDPDQMQKSGASKEEIEEVEAAIAAMRQRLGEPERVGEKNEVLEVVTKEDFDVQVIAFSKGAPVLFFVRAEGCNGSSALGPMLEDAVRDHPAALRLPRWIPPCWRPRSASRSWLLGGRRRCSQRTAASLSQASKVCLAMGSSGHTCRRRQTSTIDRQSALITVFTRAGVRPKALIAVTWHVLCSS